MVLREITAAPGEKETEGSAEEWLKAGDAENLKNAIGVLPGIKEKYWHLIGDVARDLSIEFASEGAFEIVQTLVVAGI